MNDRNLIFEQYMLLKEEEEPTMTVNSTGDREWTLSNGKLHRLDGPAIEWADGTKEWWVNNKRHREDGPAIEWASGKKEWYLNNKRHRVGGPAIERADGFKVWFLKGKCHREDGPAVEYAGGHKEWYLNHKYYPEPREWAEAVLKLHKKPHDQKDIEEFLRDIYAKNAEDLL